MTGRLYQQSVGILPLLKRPKKWVTGIITLFVGVKTALLTGFVWAPPCRIPHTKIGKIIIYLYCQLEVTAIFHVMIWNHRD